MRFRELYALTLGALILGCGGRVELPVGDADGADDDAGIDNATCPSTPPSGACAGTARCRYPDRCAYASDPVPSFACDPARSTWVPFDGGSCAEEQRSDGCPLVAPIEASACIGDVVYCKYVRPPPCRWAICAFDGTSAIGRWTFASATCD